MSDCPNGYIGDGAFDPYCKYCDGGEPLPSRFSMQRETDRLTTQMKELENRLKKAGEVEAELRVDRGKLMRQVATLKRTSDYWKAEHLAGNLEIDRLLAYAKERDAIDTTLRGRVCDPDPLPMMSPYGLSIETTYGLVMGLLRERDALRAENAQLKTARDGWFNACGDWQIKHNNVINRIIEICEEYHQRDPVHNIAQAIGGVIKATYNIK